MIFLFTDFGAADLYVGQVKAVLVQSAPSVSVIDLLNDAARFRVEPAAHLLAALAQQLPIGSVTLAVVDPGVGTDRRPIVMRCEGRWFVGPDNGLLSVLAARASECELWEICWRPPTLSRSFHGRDLFAPIAARIAMGDLSSGDLRAISKLQVELDGGNLWQVIYIDGYGNVFTGIRGASFAASAMLWLAGQAIRPGGVFAEADQGSPFWYVDSIGVIEIACNRTSAAERLRVAVGDPVSDRAP